MKELRETKMVEQTTITYVAYDGEVFNNEGECRAHEMEKDHDKAIAKLIEMGAKTCLMPFRKWANDVTAKMWFLTIHDENEWYMAKACLKETTEREYADIYIHKPNAYPYKACYVTEINDSGDVCICEYRNDGYYKDEIERMSKCLNLMKDNLVTE